MAGHRAPGDQDRPDTLVETRQYLEDAEVLAKVALSATEFVGLRSTGTWCA